MLVMIVLTVEGKKRDGVAARQFAKNVIAANLPARIGWNQSASLYPQYFHVEEAVRS
jgi:hypothetical protein